MAELDQITVATHRFVRNNPKLVDNMSQHDPLVAYFRKTCKEDFTGGRYIAENFIYTGLVGKSYLKGAEFDTTEKQVEQQGQFNVKLYEVGVTMSKEDIQVFNKGDAQIFSLIESRMNTAYITMGIYAAISIYMNGVNAGYTPMVNGLAEALNDGTNTSWDGNVYPTYGTLTRNGVIGAAYNTTPRNVNGPLLYPTLLETFLNATYGQIMPTIGVTTVQGYAYIQEKFQTQQRFVDTQEAKIGFNGMKFLNSVIMSSRYAPGSYISGSNGTVDPNVVTYLTQTTNGAVTAYPVQNVAWESLFWINAEKPYMNFYLDTDPEYRFGFTGFKPYAGNTKITGQVLGAFNVTFNPRYHYQVYGFTA